MRGICLFFFSSRRRHTRCSRDWSSDVCSSDLYARVSTVKPDIFWVGLSTPKQEHFMAEYLPHLDTRVMVGVGAAFDVHTGRIQDAPDWMKNAGLQWLHRLGQEPRRLW